MSRSSASGSEWWKIGCLGCGGLLGLALIAAGTLFVVVRSQIRGEKVEEKVLAPELAPPAEPTVLEGSAGRVRLDLAHAEFEIEPARPGESLRVEARYDQRSYALEESHEPLAEDGWLYELRFRRTGSSLLASVRQLLGGSRPRVRVFLPPDQPIDLEVELAQGGARVELGGLWLETARIGFEQGGFELSIDEPLRAPMQSLVIEGSMGGFAAGRLGNASPRRLEASCSMGGMQLDLRGPWQDDADIRVSSSMGGAVLQLPRGVRMEGLPGAGVHLEGESELEPPTLRFETSGEIEIFD